MIVPAKPLLCTVITVVNTGRAKQKHSITIDALIIDIFYRIMNMTGVQGLYF